MCESYETQAWGTIMKAKVSFSQPPLNDESLNKVMCFFTKEVDTEILYMVDLEGNSCYDRAVSNVYFNYSGTSFSDENYQTYIYMITNPYRISDPSPTAFQNMYGTDKSLSAVSLASAVSGFAIDYLSSIYQTSFQAIDLIDRNQTTKDLVVNFDKPEYNNGQIKITNVEIGGGIGTVYFLLVLYKQINVDGNNTFVNIRLNEEPTHEQMLNCENWQGLSAEGCARAVFSESKLTVTFDNIQEKSLYMLYYTVASEYPLRPILSPDIFSETVVTFSGMSHLLLNGVILILLAIMF